MSKKNAESEPLAYRTPEAARVCGVSVMTMKRLIKSRAVPSLRVGKIRLIRKTALETFLASREGVPE